MSERNVSEELMEWVHRPGRGVMTRRCTAYLYGMMEDDQWYSAFDLYHKMPEDGPFRTIYLSQQKVVGMLRKLRSMGLIENQVRGNHRYWRKL